MATKIRSTTAPSALAPLLKRLTSRTRLNEDEQTALLALPNYRATLDPGAYIVREGDRAERCCVLLSGFVYRHKITGGGRRQILSIHLRGDAVDLQNGLLDYADHNVQALTQVDVIFISRQAIVDLCARYPAIAHAFWIDTLVDASLFREWLVNLGQRTARQRIAHLLCELALRQEAAGLCEGPNYAWPMTQEQIGEATGLTAVHVNRTLRELRARGLVKFANKRLTIDDWVALQEAADFSPDYLHQGPSRAKQLESA